MHRELNTGPPNFFAHPGALGTLYGTPKFLSTSWCFGDLVRDPKISFHIPVLRRPCTGPQNFFPHRRTVGHSRSHPCSWRIAHRYATADPSRVRRSLSASTSVENSPSLCDCRPKPRSPFTCRMHLRGDLLIAVRMPSQAAFAVHLQHPCPWRIAHRSATADPSRVRRSPAHPPARLHDQILTYIHFSTYLPA